MEEVTISRAMEIAAAYYRSGRLEEAEGICRRILAADPARAEAWNLLGTLEYHAGDPEAAIELIGRAIAIAPDVAAYQNNLGNLFRVTGRLDEAMGAYRAALALVPDLAEAYSNLANVLVAKGEVEEGIACYRRALAIDPRLVEAFSNLGNALTDQGESEAAIAAYRTALTLRPDHAEVHCNLGICLLLQGEYAEGWREYEWRWKCEGVSDARTRFSEPLWEGSALGGRTILLHAEQGFGDTIQFIRYARLVAARGGRVVVECQPELAELLRQISCVSAWVGYGEALPAFEVHCPLLSLPRVFGTTVESIPGCGEYLRAPVDRAALGKQVVGGGDRHQRKVGLVWQGSSGHKNDRRRSIAGEMLVPLGKVEGVQWVSLQQASGGAGDDELPAGIEGVDAGPLLRNFADTAAILDRLDLVITVDTAVAHLAGAMGKRVWVMLPFAPDWRWGLGGEKSSWYPTMRLFRQRHVGAWSEVIERVVAELSALRK